MLEILLELIGQILLEFVGSGLEEFLMELFIHLGEWVGPGCFSFLVSTLLGLFFGRLSLGLWPKPVFMSDGGRWMAFLILPWMVGGAVHAICRTVASLCRCEVRFRGFTHACVFAFCFALIRLMYPF